MGKFIIKNACVLLNNHFENKTIQIEDGIISSLGDICKNANCEVYDAKGMRLIPGFIDIHTHGAIGIDINNATAEEMERIGCFFASKGTTLWLGSILTETKEQTISCIKEYLRYKRLPQLGAEMFGIHLEGPFLSYEYKGAQPGELLRKVDIELIREYQTIAQGNIKYITVSPEAGADSEFITELRKLGIVVAIGHSGADYNTTMNCIHAGAMAATHTFNAMKPFDHHAPGMIGAVLESEIYCEAIFDGRHLHPGVVRLMLKTKGLEKLIAVTDSMMVAGLKDGKYSLGTTEMIVKDGDAKLSNGTRAGSTLTMDVTFRNIIEFTGRGVEEVSLMLSANPAKLFSIFDNVGSIGVGKRADFVIIDNENTVLHTFIRGKRYIN